MKSPHNVIQLSRLKAPTRGKGRPYTVDFGIAKPLYKQLLSKLDLTHSRTGPPTNDLFEAFVAINLRIRGRSLFSGILKFAKRTRTYVWKFVKGNKIRLIPGLIALYMTVGIPMNSPSRIVYADPLINPPQIEQVAMLTMPAVALVEPVSALPLPITPASAAYSLSNLYTPLNCTWYVASRLPVPGDWGNAISWGLMAAAQGYTVSDIPRVGAIAWSVTDSYLGHVALVEAVNGDVVTVSEMNYQGLGVIDNRIASPGEFRFIYL